MTYRPILSHILTSFFRDAKYKYLLHMQTKLISSSYAENTLFSLYLSQNKMCLYDNFAPHQMVWMIFKIC